MKKLTHSQHPILQEVSLHCNQDDTTLKQLIADMWEVMRYHHGQGFAACQIGVSKRVIVINSNGFRQAFINPRITKHYGGKITVNEGCLSFPGVFVSIVRFKQAIIEGFDEDWQPITRKLKGPAAICAQHEVDHLDGITLENRE